MDIVHHTLIGGSGYLIAASFDQPIAGVAFMVGSVLPDLDAFFMVLGKRFYLKNHQSISHSLLLAPLYAALLISLPLLYLLMLDWNWLVFGAAVAGLVIHVVLDLCNTFGIALFAPFSQKRFNLDAVFFIDTVTWTLTGLFYLLYIVFNFAPILYIYPALFGSYLLAKFLLHLWVVKTLSPLHAIPGSLNPFNFYILCQDEQGLYGFTYNSLTKSKKDKQRYATIEPQYAEMTAQSQIFQDMRKITRALYPTEVTKDKDGTTIVARDLAIRNFGGRFATTVLKFDTRGKLTSEVANI